VEADVEEPMTSVARSSSTIQLTALVSDSIDGMIRILGDLQRFGLHMVRCEMHALGGASEIVLTLATNGMGDMENLCARLSRHPCMLRPVALDVKAVLPRAA
jgi:hypothetical protein